MSIYHAYFSITRLSVIPLPLLFVCALWSYWVTTTSMALPVSVMSEALTVGSGADDNTCEGGTQAISESDACPATCLACSEERLRPL